MQFVDLNREARECVTDAAVSLSMARESMELTPQCTCRDGGSPCAYCRTMAFLDHVSDRLRFMAHADGPEISSAVRAAGSS